MICRFCHAYMRSMNILKTPDGRIIDYYGCPVCGYVDIDTYSEERNKPRLWELNAAKKGTKQD